MRVTWTRSTGPRLAPARVSWRCQATSEGTGVLKKIGRVLREKATVDFERVFAGTSKTRKQLGVVDELLAYWTLESSEDTLEELEDALIMADFGPRIALKLTDGIRDKIRDGEIQEGDQIFEELRRSIVELISSKMGKGDLSESDSGETAERPFVYMIVGVNGGGKTTTVGKLAHRYTQSGNKVMLAAGDTFRAAGYEQLEKWGERSRSVMGPIREGQKPSTVLYETLDTALKSKDVDVVICDTSGRLHTNYALMEELAKCKRTLAKRMEGAPHEALLVLDGTTGLNMLNQAREFHETVGLTGLILTKLDGTAKGGALLSVMDELDLPVRFVGVGEAIEDLQPFDAELFVDALLPSKETKSKL